MAERDFDIVIIGSGAGGGAVASELAQMCPEGVRIAVLEWGAKFKKEEFTGQELDMARMLYFDSGGVLTSDGTITLAYARAYGGSTVVYTGTSLVMPEEVVEEWDVPGLDWQDLRRRSEKYLSQNNAHLLTDDKINENNRLFQEGCRRLGYQVQQFPVNIANCSGSAMCNLGCPHDAKQGTHVVQLPAAERQGVKVITNCKVERIEDRVIHAVVSATDRGEPSSLPPGEYRIRARVVIVAGGAINTPALLLRSGIDADLPALGRYLTLHPALILVGEHEHRLANFPGHPKSYYSDQFLRSHGFLLETCMYFPFTTAKNLIGFGSQHSELMRVFPRLQMILVLAMDRALASNRVEVNRAGEPVVRYSLSRPVLDSLHESMKAATRIFFAAGAHRVHAPAGTEFFISADQQDRIDELIPRSLVSPGRISVTSAHTMGGCRMGGDRLASVTDAWGQVHGIPWLFVADASLFPRCSQVNPYITVMALADRVAERVRSQAGELLQS